MKIAHLGRPHSDPAAFAALRGEFVRRNPGYELDWARGLTHGECQCGGDPKLVDLR